VSRIHLCRDDDKPTHFEKRLAELQGGQRKLTTRERYMRAERIAVFLEAERRKPPFPPLFTPVTAA
jgi:hypothetical protein